MNYKDKNFISTKNKKKDLLQNNQEYEHNIKDFYYFILFLNI